MWKRRGLNGGWCGYCGQSAANRCTWIPVVVESRRVKGKTRQVHVARLPSIRSCCLDSASARMRWWVRVDAALTELAGEDDAVWERLFEALAAKVRYEWPDEEARPQARALAPADTAAVLGIAWPAPIAELKARFRTLAKEHHPDLGGRHEDFVRVRKAFELLVALAG